MQESTPDPRPSAMVRRLALWGPAIVGFGGLVLAINASLSDQYAGAGVCLIASALAFASIAHTFRHE